MPVTTGLLFDRSTDGKTGDKSGKHTVCGEPLPDLNKRSALVRLV